MATKLQLVTAMYDYKAAHVTDSYAEWTQFLRSAARNYKLSFEEQVLVHTQRPEATAVLELEKWNTQFGRWVNKGAVGIAVVDRAALDKRRLKYYFDISDTHDSRTSHPVPIWEMKPEYESDVSHTGLPCGTSARNCCAKTSRRQRRLRSQSNYSRTAA